MVVFKPNNHNHDKRNGEKSKNNSSDIDYDNNNKVIIRQINYLNEAYEFDNSSQEENSIRASSSNSSINESDISIAWKHLRYETNLLENGIFSWLSSLWTSSFTSSSKTSSSKVILKCLNGHLKYQTLNAFLGPSGAGKTTLLNCLNGTLRSGLSNDSEIYLNPREGDYPVIRFVEQHVHDKMMGKMTVNQILSYAFRFKNSYKQHKQMSHHIRMILHELMLEESILDRKFEKCSGGEQRRIAIAQELMSLRMPSFLFVDEPTTGLDSTAAFLVMKCLRKLIDTNKYMTILVSIHTPASDIMQLFDKVYVLAKGGACIYSDSPKFLVQNLKQQIGLDLDENKPPIEEYVKIACCGTDDEIVQKLAKETLYQEHEQLQPNIDRLKFMDQGIHIKQKSFSFGDMIIQLLRMLHLIFVLELRNIINTVAILFLVFLFFSTVVDPKSVEANTCYMVNNSDTEEKCQERMYQYTLAEQYSLYQALSMVLIGFTTVCMSAIVFAPMLKWFINEHRNRWYSMGVFFWSVVIVRMLEISLVALFLTIFYYFVEYSHMKIDHDQFNWYRFGSFGLFIWIFCLYIQAWGQYCGMVFLNYIEIGIVTAEVLYMGAHLCDGYVFTKNMINNSFFQIITNIFGLDVFSKGMLYTTFGLQRCQFDSGEKSLMLDELQIDADNVYWNLWRVLAVIVYLRFQVWILLSFKFSWTINKKKFIQTNDLRPKQIDFNTSSYINTLVDIDLEKTNKQIKRIKSKRELEFEKFSRNKIMVAFRSLTLFGTHSIYEKRNVSIDSTEQKLILRNLNGHFRFRTLNAIMGTSGAGKTSLLKVLNGQSKSRISEESKFYLSKHTPIRTCYLTQEVSGHLIPGLTVKQSLIYASRLKNINETNIKIDHEYKALMLLDDIDMIDAADTMVHKCSGGQRKRLALALELTALRMPNFVCIDEPTSGLDSNSAQVVIKCLRRFVEEHNLAIVATIHQPNTDILMEFDQIQILARGGVCIYSGPPTQIRDQLRLLPQQAKSNMDAPEFPIEKMIEYSCMNYENDNVKKLVEATTDKLLKDDQYLLNDTRLMIDGIALNRTRFSLNSVWILVKRNWFYIKGYAWPQYFFLFYFLPIFYGSFISLMLSGHENEFATVKGCRTLLDNFNLTCYGNNEDLSENLRKRILEQRHEMTVLGINFRYTFYSTLIYMAIMMIQSSVMFNMEFDYFKNEHRNGWYTTGVFFLVKSIMEITPLIPLVIIYPYVIDMWSLEHPEIIYWMMIIVFLASITAQGYGQCCAMFSNGNLAMIITLIPAMCEFWLILCNIIQPVSHLHYVYQLLAIVNPFSNIGESFLLLQYGFGRCREKEIAMLLYKIDMMNDSYFYHCIQRIITNALLYKTIAFIMLLIKNNPNENRKKRADRIMRTHQQLKSSNVYIPGLGCHQEFHIKMIDVGQE